MLRIPWIPISLVLLLANCATPPGPGGAPASAVEAAVAPSWMPAPSDASLPSDSSLFAAVLRSLPLHEDAVLRVDPRPLVPDPDLVWTGAARFAEGTEGATRLRRSILAEIGIEPLSDAEYPRCERQGRGGLRPPMDPEEPPERAAERERLRDSPTPLCVVTALPRPGGVHFPPEGIDEREAGLEKGHVTTRVVTVEPAQYAVLDVVAQRDGSAWRIVEQRVLFRVWS
jgi:hypothetical protein